MEPRSRMGQDFMPNSTRSQTHPRVVVDPCCGPACLPVLVRSRLPKPCRPIINNERAHGHCTERRLTAKQIVIRANRNAIQSGWKWTCLLPFDMKKTTKCYQKLFLTSRSIDREDTKAPLWQNHKNVNDATKPNAPQPPHSTHLFRCQISAWCSSFDLHLPLGGRPKKDTASKQEWIWRSKNGLPRLLSATVAAMSAMPESLKIKDFHFIAY